MPRRKNGLLVIIVCLFLAIGGIFLYYIHLSEKRKSFEKLQNSEMKLQVNLGVIPRKKVLKESNALIKRVKKDNESFIYITKDNILFTYYYDTYYVIDPMQGIHKDFEIELSEETVQSILKEIKNKWIDSLQYKNQSDYLTVTIEGKTQYIERTELQYIIQNHNLELPIYKIN